MARKKINYKDYETIRWNRVIIVGAIFLAIVFLIAFVIYNIIKPKEENINSNEKHVSQEIASSPAAIQATPEPKPADITEGFATFFQGPKAWKKRMEWSGKWGKTKYDGVKFGAFGCGLCCMANIYSSFSQGNKCSPVDMYKYAKKNTSYEGGMAIDWDYMKETLTKIGFTCQIGNKPLKYEDFQSIVRNNEALIACISSDADSTFWKDTPGHYITIFAYNQSEDSVFIGDSGNLDHNRTWVPLNYIYKALKTENSHQYMTAGAYDSQKDGWKNKKISGKCILPKAWKQSNI